MKKSEICKRYGITQPTLKLWMQNIPELKGNKNKKLNPKEVAILEAQVGKMPKEKIVNK